MLTAGVVLRLHSWAVDVATDGNSVTGVVLESKSRRLVAPARMIIDATGGGDLCMRAGVPYHLGMTPDDAAPAVLRAVVTVGSGVSPVLWVHLLRPMTGPSP